GRPATTRQEVTAQSADQLFAADRWLDPATAGGLFDAPAEDSSAGHAAAPDAGPSGGGGGGGASSDTAAQPEGASPAADGQGSPAASAHLPPAHDSRA